MANPLDPSESLHDNINGVQDDMPHLNVEPQPEDSAVTKAEKVERTLTADPDFSDDPRPSKRLKLESNGDGELATPSARQKGIAPVKAEYLIQVGQYNVRNNGQSTDSAVDDRDRPEGDQHRKRERNKGQNVGRRFGSSRDEIGLCASRATSPEFSPSSCRFGDKCKFEHDLRKYLKEGKREDLSTFGGKCPIWETKGRCDAGWKCRFAGSHSEEHTHADGRKELRLVEDYDRVKKSQGPDGSAGYQDVGVANVVSTEDKIALTKKIIKTPKADAYVVYLDKLSREQEKFSNQRRALPEEDSSDAEANEKAPREDNRASYVEPPFLPSEKRRIYFGPETPVLAPLTTQGNLPFRRLCVSLGAQMTYSEMAMSLPLMQGQKSEWALIKAHESELNPPTYKPSSPVIGYDNAKDLKFGTQICASKPFQALKAAEILTQLCPHLRVIDLNCGCPIDLVYRQGAGSALLDSPSKLDKILRGMGAVSGDIPITAKIRTGTKDGKPTSLKLVNRLVYGNQESNDIGPKGSCGVAAITLHGRSRQQRYTKSADWTYISDCAALIKRHQEEGDALADTVREGDARQNPAGSDDGKVYFIGNGDCYSHVDYNEHIANAGVDSVMIARGAIIKPWLFEEIESGQYLDKSATERLGYVDRFCRYGLENWGSDEMGIGLTRRFLLEWLSFAYRYVPIGILEHLPPSLQDRPPAWRGRNELETLLGSDNYKDWIKISEMYLGPVHKGFQFEPKHRSNSYEVETEG
ncbi:tRNA-dihydrouridine synthase 3 [Agyrium rufum]|nr:tRNA-dihydrouridine synthase 3 [Agyrium rufum]